MKALFRYFDGYRRQLVLGPLFKLTEAVLELFVPLLMANIIDVGIKNGDVKYVVTHGLFMLGLGAVGLACALTCQYFAAVCAQGFGRSLRKDLFRHVFSLSQAEYGSVGTNSLITRLTSDVNQVQTGVNMFIRLAIRAPFLTVGSIVMAFTINWKIALVFLLSTPLIVFVLYRVMSRSLPEYTRIQRQQDVISRLAGENLEGARVIRAFSKQDSEIEQFQQAGDTLSDITIRVGKLSAALNPITSVIANLAIVAIVWFGGLFAQDGGIEQGQIIAMVNYMTQTLLALIVLANIIVILTKALASAKRVSEVLAQESSGASALHRRGRSTGSSNTACPPITGASTVFPSSVSVASPTHIPSSFSSARSVPAARSSESCGLTHRSARWVCAFVNSATLRKIPDMRQKSWSSSQLAEEKRYTRTARRFSPSRCTAGVRSNSAGVKLSSL